MGTGSRARYRPPPPIFFHLAALLLACLLAFPSPLLPADIPGLAPEIRAVMESPRYRHARWGLFVQDIASGETVYDVHADTLIGPASVTKLFTAAAALEDLGRDFTFKTPVYYQGTLDKQGILNGSLILVARGDFFFSGIKALAAQIKAAGIKAVTGEILIDDRHFKPYRAYSVSRPGRLLYVLGPAMVHDNLIEFTIRPSRLHDAASVTWQPQAACLRITARIRTVHNTEPEKIDIAEDAAGHMAISGQIPAGSPAVTRAAPVSDPSSLLRSLLINALKKSGVRVQASPARPNPAARLPGADAYEKKMKKTAQWVSPPLADYLRTILKTSHNQGADMLPLLLAVKNGRDTFEEGMKREKTFLERAGLYPAALSLGDGSGISPANMVTPRAVVQFLKFMAAHRDAALFRDGLPVLGMDGTLAGAVGEGSPARGKVQAKTGTIGLFDLMNDSGFVQIKSLAGYMRTASGRPFAFALFVNHVHATDAPDRPAVLKLTQAVGSDLAAIVELIYNKH